MLGYQWVQTLGPILSDYVALCMEFTIDNKTYTLRGLEARPIKNISSNWMEKILKKGQHCTKT